MQPTARGETRLRGGLLHHGRRARPRVGHRIGGRRGGVDLRCCCLRRLFGSTLHRDLCQPQVGTDPDVVTINSNGRLGRANVSSRRYKHDIQPMHDASEAIYALKPVSFRYHKEYDQTQTIAFGLIAEEVAEVNPDLVGRNPKGQPESVRYEQINAMLLNEFLKEHRRGEQQDCKIQEQETTIAELRSEIRSLAAMVNKQASELWKVSAQLPTSNDLQAIAKNP